jgi:hypothetical protein
MCVKPSLERGLDSLKPLRVFCQRGKLACLAAQFYLITDQVEDGLWVCSELRMLIQVRLDQHTFTYIPAATLIRLQQIQQL